MKLLAPILLLVAFLPSIGKTESNLLTNESELISVFRSAKLSIYDREKVRESEMQKRQKTRENRALLDEALDRSYRCGDSKCSIEDGETFQTCPLDCVSVRGDIVSYNSQSVCSDVKSVHKPKNLNELVSIISEISNLNEDDAKIRFLGARHSTSSLICTKGHVILSTNFSNPKDIKIEDFFGEKVVSTPGGVSLGDLIDYLELRGYSLGFAYPMYRGVTVAGLLATGSHGSSRKHTAVSSQNIREISIIDARGENHILTFEKTPDEFRAAKTNLGLMGFVYNLKLKIYPMFNVKMNVSSIDEFVSEKENEIKWGRVCDFEIVKWFPSINNAVKYCGDKTSESAFRNAESVALGKYEDEFMFPREKLAIKLTKYLLEKSRRYPFVGKLMSKYSYKNSLDKPSYTYMKSKWGRDVEVSGNNIVGKASKMLHNRLTKGIFQSFSAEDFSFSFPMSRAKEILSFVKKFSEEHEYAFPFIGFYMRFARSEDNDKGALLSNIQKDGEKEQLYILAEFFEYQYFNLDNKYLDRINSKRSLLLKTLVENYDVSLHWGKSNLKLFKDSDVQSYYGKNLSLFKEIVRDYDPESIFSNQFSEVLHLQ